jgi:hypothetical protein
MPRLLAAVLGGFLFWNAGVLSESTPFRFGGTGSRCTAASAHPVLLHALRGRASLPESNCCVLPAFKVPLLGGHPSFRFARRKQEAVVALQPSLLPCTAPSGGCPPPPLAVQADRWHCGFHGPVQRHSAVCALQVCGRAQCGCGPGSWVMCMLIH